MIKREFAIILVILITIEIFWFSSLTGDVTPGGSPWISRTYHFTVFFLFTFFLLAAINAKKKLKLNYLISALVIGLLYALLDELHQAFVPMRDAGIVDILTDSLGIFAAILIFYFISSKIKKKSLISHKKKTKKRP